MIYMKTVLKCNIFIITRNTRFAQDLILWPPTRDSSTLTHDLNCSRTAPDLPTCYLHITPHAFTGLYGYAVWNQTFCILILRLVHYSPLLTSPSNTILLQSFQSMATVRELLTPFISGSSSASSVLLFCGLPLFLFPPFVQSHFFLAFFRYPSFPYVYIILI